MELLMQSPGYNFLSAPLWLITALHLVTLTVHFIAMNFVVGGIVAILWGKFRNRWEDPPVQTFLKLFPSGLAATITLGVAPLLFLQLVYHRQVYAAAIVSGWFWLMIIAVLIVTYYLLYAVSFKSGKSGRSHGLFLTIALAGMIYVSLVYSSVFSLAERPSLIAHLYAQDQSGTIWNPELGDWVLRWLHMIFGAVTVGGFFVGLIGRNNEDAFKVGKSFFLGGLVITSLAGIGYLLSLADYLKPFMHTPGIWALTLGVLLSLGSLHMFFTKKFLPAGVMLFVSIFCMVMTRHYVRLLKLDGQFDPSSLPVQSQWGVFGIFLICFVAAIGILVYMFRLYFKSIPRT
jgi:hypothetical protein